MNDGVGVLGRDVDEGLVLLIVADIVEEIKIYSMLVEAFSTLYADILHMLSMITRKFVFMSVIE